MKFETGKSESNGKGSTDAAVVTQEKQSEPNSALLSENYKLPLVWIDLEMTGKHSKGLFITNLVTLMVIVRT